MPCLVLGHGGAAAAWLLGAPAVTARSHHPLPRRPRRDTLPGGPTGRGQGHTSTRHLSKKRVACGLPYRSGSFVLWLDVGWAVSAGCLWCRCVHCRLRVVCCVRTTARPSPTSPCIGTTTPGEAASRAAERAVGWKSYLWKGRRRCIGVSEVACYTAKTSCVLLRFGRFFTPDVREQDGRTGNVRAGLVVDSGLTHPT